jgi:Leucine-rich repeat (LRR) protein
MAVIPFDRIQLKKKFTDLESLEELDLSEADIELVDPFLLSGLIKLKELDLSLNKLKSIDANLFIGNFSSF